jgi:hypothetical protein
VSHVPGFPLLHSVALTLVSRSSGTPAKDWSGPTKHTGVVPPRAALPNCLPVRVVKRLDIPSTVAALSLKLLCIDLFQRIALFDVVAISLPCQLDARPSTKTPRETRQSPLAAFQRQSHKTTERYQRTREETVSSFARWIFTDSIQPLVLPALPNPAVAPKLAEDGCGFYERQHAVGKTGDGHHSLIQDGDQVSVRMVPYVRPLRPPAHVAHLQVGMNMTAGFQTDTLDRMGAIPRVSPRVDDFDSRGDNIAMYVSCSSSSMARRAPR